MSRAEELSQNRYPTMAEKYACIDGYEQAEKDLSDISWIKEVSGVKEMSRAKEEALKVFPPQSIAANHDTIDRRDAFEYGYLKAEKDLLENKHETSWRLDEKLWKGIKDIEEASYQYMYDASNDWAYDIPTWKDVQDAFKAGSKWKEDIALSWEDIKTIDKLLNQCVDYSNPYQEVLRRFKGYKERKEK